MPATLNEHQLTIFPPLDEESCSGYSQAQRDSPIELGLADAVLYTHKMASATSPPTYIKSEPNDFFDTNHFNQFGNNGAHSQMTNNNINPASLSNSVPQNNYSSFSGNAGIADDELFDLHFDQNQNQNNFNNGNDFQSMQNLLQQPHSGLFSHTPDGAPIQSPFTNEFNYSQFRSMSGQQFGNMRMAQPPNQAFQSVNMQQQQLNNTRSPTTPTLNVTDEYTHPGMQPIVHRHQSSLGNAGWDSTPSGHSWEGSPSMASPLNGHHSYHPQISEVLKNQQHLGKVAHSLPTKMEPGAGPVTSTQEIKRRRRRESHNMVERRRRDNINERIHDLGTLVPQHRLEDEKVRKHLQTNAPLSPSIAQGGISPPNSSLSGGPRRPPGNITQGFPVDDKDKGPNKGDILNGSVAWTRDMMWYLHQKLDQEEKLKQLLASMGKEWPFPTSEEEKRMRSEICEVLAKHQSSGGFTGYSRAPGSGLRVPNFTNIAGDSLAHGIDAQSTSLPPISPGFQGGGSGMSSGPQFWSPDDDLKEEDEYEMDMQ